MPDDKDKDKDKNKNKNSQELTTRSHCGSIIFLLLLLVLLTVASVRIVRWQKRTSSPETAPISPTSTASVPTPAPQYNREERLLAGVNDRIEQLNPLYASGDGEIDVIALVFQALFRVDDQGEVVPQLAREWAYSKDEALLTVQLRTDHTFRDGRVVEAEDVIYTYNCLLSPAYDGPLSGRLIGLEAILPGPDEQTVLFQFSPAVDQPDLMILTAGILKADYYPYEPERIFELKDSNLLPEGSGSFFVREQSENHVELELRSGYAGQIKTIEIRQIASEAKYRFLREGQLDVVRNVWDKRMQQRSQALPDYSFHPYKTSADNYFLLNPEPLPQSQLRQPEQRLALLELASGKTLSASQLKSLEPLKNSTLTLYYFQGVDADVRYSNRQQADELAALLGQAGLQVLSKGIFWPEMAERAANHNYDLMLFPATANSRLPQGARLLGQAAQADATALVYSYRPEVFIVCQRLEQLTVNPYAHPFAASVGSWTDRVENIRIRQADESKSN